MLKQDNKKASKEFIEYLKDTPMIPNKKTQLKSVHDQKVKYYGPVEGDFSKIGCSYILENDRLRKKSIEYNKKARKNTKQNEQIIEEDEKFAKIEGVDFIKEKAKLEYLQKKGFLKPEQKTRLEKIKSQQNKFSLSKEPIKMSQLKITPKEHIFYQTSFSTPSHKNPAHLFMHQKPFNNDQNFDPNYHYEHYLPNEKGKMYHNHNYPANDNYPQKMIQSQKGHYYPYNHQEPKYYKNQYQMSYGQPQVYHQQNYRY